MRQTANITQARLNFIHLFDNANTILSNSDLSTSALHSSVVFAYLHHYLIKSYYRCTHFFISDYVTTNIWLDSDLPDLRDIKTCDTHPEIR